MIYIKAKDILIFLVIFLCLIETPAVYADSEEQDEVAVVNEEHNNLEEQDRGEVNKDETEESPPPAKEQIASPPDVSPTANPIDNLQAGIAAGQAAMEKILDDESSQSAEPLKGEDTEFDDVQLAYLTRTLRAEKQRLEDLTLEHKKLFEEVMARLQQDHSDDEGVLSEEHLLTTVKQDAMAASSRREALERASKVDFKDLKPEANVDLLGTADGLYKLLQYETALKVYLSIDPEKTREEDNAWILCQITNCYKNLKQFDNAVTTCEELLAKYPKSYPAKEANWNLENLNWWKQWYGKAKLSLEMKEKIKPQSPPSNAEGE
jgi:tetratricopeptide (TPR) repeat protein